MTPSTGRVPPCRPVPRAFLTAALWAFLAATAPAQGGRVVLIDPGHGGDDAGVRGTTAVEKIVTFQMAERLREILSYTTRLDVRLTRSADTAVPLVQRAAQANLARAGLLVSLQCAWSRRKEDRGFIVYYYRPSPVEESRTEVIRGMIDGREIRLAPATAAQLAWLQPSRRLAEIIQQRLGLVFQPFTGAPAAERLYLLSALNCPAVAIEVCFLSNAEDEKDILTPRVQDEFCRRLADAVADFLQ